MSDQELIILERVGDRLLAALSSLVAAMPVEAQGISGMSRWLGVHKATCQRVIEGLTQSDEALTAFVRLPGVRALRQLLDGARARGVRPEAVASAEAAIEQFEEVLASRGLSQRGLIDRIASLRSTSRGGTGSTLHRRRAQEQRRVLYSAAKRLTGESLDAKVVVAVVVPSPVDPSRLRASVLVCLRGAVREASARPIVPFILTGEWEAAGAGGSGAGSHAPHRPGSATWRVIESLSTAGIRAVSLVGRAGRTVLTIDAPELAASGAHDARGESVNGRAMPPERDVDDGSEQSVDIGVLFQSDAMLNPRAHPEARVTAAVRIPEPTRVLVHDVYLHESLAPKGLPSVACLALTAPSGSSPDGGLDDCWYDRFPETPTIQRLGVGIDHPGVAAPIGTLPRRLAEQIVHPEGLDPRTLVGFRCVERYPLWQSEYRSYF
jgi:hypothetical protein